MDTRPPHDIRGFHDLDKMDEKERKHFVPIPEAEVVDLEALSPIARAKWLRNRRQRTLDMPLASSIAQGVYDREMKYLETVREETMKSKRERESLSKLLGYVLGVRAFIYEFLREEHAIASVLSGRCGVSDADYARAINTHMRTSPKPRLYEVVERLVNGAPVFHRDDPDPDMDVDDHNPTFAPEVPDPRDSEGLFVTDEEAKLLPKGPVNDERTSESLNVDESGRNPWVD